MNDYDISTKINDYVDEALYVDEIKEQTFLGFLIKNQYDHLRFVIPERFQPKRINVHGKLFYGIWVESSINENNSNNCVTLIRYTDKILLIPIGDGDIYIDQNYRNFDTIVYKESVIPFYHKLGQMYICIFLP